MVEIRVCVGVEFLTPRYTRIFIKNLNILLKFVSGVFGL